MDRPQTTRAFIDSLPPFKQFMAPLPTPRKGRAKRLLIAATGSVATVKLPHILQLLTDTYDSSTLEVAVLLTPNSIHFIHDTLLSLNCVKSGRVQIWTDEAEWTLWKKLGDPVLHIELRKWADVLLIAPLSANELSKLAVGSCEGLLSSVVRAWDFEPQSGEEEGYRKRVVVAPAMNTAMWRHPVTSKQLDVLRGWGFRVLPVERKLLACGDLGEGGMREWKTLVKEVSEVLELDTAPLDEK
ncbi:flavo protein [Ascobolus immersus RN42]|uniref:Flavo protein n=1 Tax=Ascobolus immersus RN42 TaxID=1160509 RepID=A0A3N4IJN9_ASCIM|nr:flavo protein [Ascobolus immersus RN42]